MILMIILAVFAAIILAFALHPLMKKNSKLAWRVIALCAVISVGTYLVIGSPDIPSAPALFEKSGPRNDQRLLQRRELLVMEALAADPDNVRMLLELGTIRINENRGEDALDVLQRARTLAPNNPDIAEAIGAAHYSIARLYAIQPRQEAQQKAREHLEKALQITPKTTDLYKHLRTIQRDTVKTLSP